jgi:hypothetical protein
VLIKIVYLLTCRILGLAVLVFRGDRAKDAELLVLRQAEHGRRLRWFSSVGNNGNGFGGIDATM